jgi:site-specific recombinase XerC
LKRISVLQPEPPVPTGAPKLSEFYAEFCKFAETVYSKETIGIYKRSFTNLIAVVGDIHLSSLSQRQVDLFRSRRLGVVRKVTLNIELRTLRAAFFTALRWGMITENPFKQVKLCQLDDDPPLFDLTPKR